MASTASEILGRIENDAVFQGFLESGFDPAAFASKIVRADVGRATANASAAGGAGAAPVLQLQQGVDGVGSSKGGGMVASAESVSSQAEITLEVRFVCGVPPRAPTFVLFCLRRPCACTPSSPCEVDTIGQLC